MLQVGSVLKVTDKTGVMFAQCIKVLGSPKSRIAYLGDMIIVSVIRINPRKFLYAKDKWKQRFLCGTVHRCLVIRTKVNFCRTYGVYLRFMENTVIFVTNQGVPVSNKVYGPVLLELCKKWPSLGCVSNYMF